MADQNKQGMETISALMDGEVSEFELHRVLKEIVQDDELRHKWQRYHMVSAALKSELPPRMVDLSDNICAAIDAEPSHSGKADFSRFVKPLSRFAIAASVTAIAVLGVQRYQVGQLEQGTVNPVAAIDVSAEDGRELFVPRAYRTPEIPLSYVNKTNQFTAEPAEQRPVIILQKVQTDAQFDQKLLQNRLNELLLQHADNAALNGYQGMMPFARIPQPREE